MKSFLKITAAILLATAASAPAFAAQFYGSYGVAAHTSGLGLLVGTSQLDDLNAPGFSLDNVGDTYSTNLFSIFTEETDVGADDLAGKLIKVTFAFTSPDSFGGDVDGTTVGSKALFGIFQEGKLSWADIGYGKGTNVFDFGNGGKLQVHLSDTTFNKGLFGLKPGERHGGIVKADFTLNAISAVPEPASWALMITGFGLIGGAMRHSNRKRTPAIA